MDPIVTILRFGEMERPIGSYGVMLSVALLVGVLMAVRAAVRAKIDGGATVAALGFGVAAAFAGGWLLFVGVEWARTGSPVQGVTRPGLVFFGAPLLGFPVFALACRWLRLPLGRLLDVSTPAAPAAHAVGRIGCFLGGCCYGEAWEGPWAVRYTHELAPAAHPPVLRHPTPLYESAALLVLAFVFVVLPPRSVGNGRRIAVYLFAYGWLRMLIELFRGDLVRGVWLEGLLSTSQLIALVLVLASGIYLVRGHGLVGKRATG